MSEEFDLVVIGAGPGGYVAALRAAQLGLKSCVIEQIWTGGTCLWVGCIPSKTWLHSSELFEAMTHNQEAGIRVNGASFDVVQALANKRKIVQKLSGGIDMLYSKYKVKSIRGRAIVTGPNTVQVEGGPTITARNILLATGSTARALPNLPFDEKRICSSTGALDFEAVPRHLIVIGGGIIGVELGSVWRRLGAKVTVIEMLDRIVPTMEPHISRALLTSLKKQGIEFHLSTKVLGAQVQGEQVVVEIEGQKIEGDRLMVSIGRKPASDNIGLEKVGVQLDKGGRVIVDGSFRTSVPSIFAIGDLIDGPMLAHKASEEGFAVADLLAGRHPHINYAAIPSVAYTHPEVASVGFTEQEARDLGLDVKSVSVPFRSNPRGIATDETDGFAMLIAEKTTGRLVGMHLMGPWVSEMIHIGMMAIECKATCEQISHCCFGHPTYSEVIKEAALDLCDRPLHG